MTSARQQAANARNAQRSTGPATASGRTRSAKNATTHGLTATGSALLESEDAKAYARHIEEYRANHEPQNEQQAFFVTQLAEAAWRLRRVRKFENGILNADPSLSNEGTLDKVCKLNRYEAAIERTYYRAYRELERLSALYHKARVAAIDAYILAPIHRTPTPSIHPDPTQHPDPKPNRDRQGAAAHPATTNRTQSQNRTPLDPGLRNLLDRCQAAADSGADTI